MPSSGGPHIYVCVTSLRVLEGTREGRASLPVRGARPPPLAGRVPSGQDPVRGAASLFARIDAKILVSDFCPVRDAKIRALITL